MVKWKSEGFNIATRPRQKRIGRVHKDSDVVHKRQLWNCRTDIVAKQPLSFTQPDTTAFSDFDFAVGYNIQGYGADLSTAIVDLAQALLVYRQRFTFEDHAQIKSLLAIALPFPYIPVKYIATDLLREDSLSQSDNPANDFVDFRLAS